MLQSISRSTASVLIAGTLALGVWAPGLQARAITAPAPALADDPVGAAYKKIASDVGPALVTVKFILKVEAGGQMAEYFGRYADEGVETEVTGLMIEPSGLVLVSNTQLGGYFAMYASRMGGGVSANPTELKILAGDDTEGVKAKMLARDKDLDLAWIKIEDPQGKTYPYVDLGQSGSPAVGDKLFTISRKGKFFDHAMVISEGRVGGTTKKPRPLIIPSGLGAGGGMGEIGMPVLDSSGKLAGISILQMPSKEDMEGGDAGDLMSGGGMAIMVLPASEVAKATARSKELGGAEKGEKSEKKSEAAAPATPSGGDKK